MAGQRRADRALRRRRRYEPRRVRRNASYTWCGRNPERVYGSSYLNGCDRSDVAEIRSAEVAVDERVNLACSGAVTKNVLRAVDGGVSFKGEPPQADQLADVAARDDVRLVVLSIGGNDLGFSDILTTCAEDFLTPIGAAPCKPSQDPIRTCQTAATTAPPYPCPPTTCFGKAAS